MFEPVSKYDTKLDAIAKPSGTVYIPVGSEFEKIELQGQNANGDNVYLITFSNGATASFIAPKGEKGDSVSIPLVRLI